MANLQITPDNLITTLEAQRNEAWNAAARAGAALQDATRQIAELEQMLADLKANDRTAPHEVETPDIA